MKVQEDMPKKQHVWHKYSMWWFQIYFYFTSLLGEDSHSDSYFSNGFKPPTSCKLHSKAEDVVFSLYMFLG